MSEPKIVLVPRDLFYHEIAYVRGLETAARAMLAALKLVDTQHGRVVLKLAHVDAIRAAIAQAEAAGIKVQP